MIAVASEHAAVVAVRIPGSPLGQNACYRIVIIGRGKSAHATLAMTKEGKAYKAEIQRVLRAVRPVGWDTGTEVDVDAVYWFDSRRPDVDGPGKLTLDAIQCSKGEDDGLLLNDRQVRRFTQTRRLDRERPRLELTVRAVPQFNQRELPMAAARSNP